jgi:hypothetical protein
MPYALIHRLEYMEKKHTILLPIQSWKPSVTSSIFSRRSPNISHLQCQSPNLKHLWSPDIDSKEYSASLCSQAEPIHWNRFLGGLHKSLKSGTRLHRLAESIPWSRFLASLNVYKFRLTLLAMVSNITSPYVHCQNKMLFNNTFLSSRFLVSNYFRKVGTGMHCKTFLDQQIFLTVLHDVRGYGVLITLCMVTIYTLHRPIN